MTTNPDVVITNEGSLIGFQAISDAGRDWIADHLPDDAPRFGSRVFTEHRYAQDIIDGMENDGLILG